MSTATAVLDTERLVAELRKDGVPEVKAYAIARRRSRRAGDG